MMKRTAFRLVPAVALLAGGVAWLAPHLSGQNSPMPSTKNGEWPMYTADLRMVQHGALFYSKHPESS